MTLAQAIGTTFTLDMPSALAVPLSFAARDLGETPDPIGVMEAVRSCAERIDVFYQAGQAAVPAQASDVLAFLEPLLHAVTAPRPGHLFHPKVWFLKYVDADDDVAYRLVCSTRNLTGDRSWDAVISLDGSPGRRREPANEPLVQFLRALPRMVTGQLQDVRRTRIEALAQEAQRVVWEGPDNGEVMFHALGLGRASSVPDFSGYRRLVVAPFVDADGLAVVAPPTRQGTVLIARAEQLDRLEQIPDGLDVRVLSVLAELEDERASGELSGLHAKLTIVERASRSHLFIGSANATRAAYDGNVEFLVEVIRGGTKFGVEAHLAVDTGLGALVEDYTPQAPIIAPDEDARFQLENLLRALAERRWTVSVKQAGEHFELTVGSDTALPSASARITVELLTRRGEAVEVTPGAVAQLVFDEVALADITPFLVLTAREKDVSVTSVVPAQLLGDPADRLDAVLARQVDSPEKFLRFLLLLLGLSGSQSGEGAVAGSGGQGSWATGGAAVFELLAKALGDHPRSLDDLCRIVDRLRRTEAGLAVMPDGFLELWTTLDHARRLVGAKG